MRGKEVEREGAISMKRKEEKVCERGKEKERGRTSAANPFIGGKEKEKKSILDSQRKEAMH